MLADDAVVGLKRRREPLAVPTEPEPEPDKDDDEAAAVAAPAAAFCPDAAPFNADDDGAAPALALAAAPPAAGGAVGGWPKYAEFRPRACAVGDTSEANIDAGCG